MGTEYYLVTAMSNDELEANDVDIHNPKAVIDYLSAWHYPETESDSVSYRGTFDYAYLSQSRYTNRWICDGTEYVLTADDDWESNAAHRLYCAVGDY